MVVPRSATLAATDDEFSLYAVTTFKKYSQELLHKCREEKWVPRDFKYVEGGIEEERKEVDRVGADARRLWGETLRLARTGWSEAVMVWVHVLVLRVFVETVLRYGLPLDFVCALVRVSHVNHLISPSSFRQIFTTSNLSILPLLILPFNYNLPPVKRHQTLLSSPKPN